MAKTLKLGKTMRVVDLCRDCGKAKCGCNSEPMRGEDPWVVQEGDTTPCDDCRRYYCDGHCQR